MTNPRTLPFRRFMAAGVIACFALVALPAAGNAAYKKPAEGHFIATLKGSQTSTWLKPRANGTITCFGTNWVEGDGAQTFKFETKPFKLRIYKSGKTWYFSYNNFRQDNYETGVKTRITLTREGDIRHGEDAGACGGGGPTTSTGPYDCGTKTNTFEAQLTTNTEGNIELDVGPAIGYPFKNFSTCPLTLSEGVTNIWTAIDHPWQPAKLVKSKRSSQIRSAASWETINPGPRDTRTTTGTTWTLKLKPVK